MEGETVLVNGSKIDPTSQAKNLEIIFRFFLFFTSKLLETWVYLPPRYSAFPLLSLNSILAQVYCVFVWDMAVSTQMISPLIFHSSCIHPCHRDNFKTF